MSNYLALYDLTGIQDFIYKTSELKEIIGGSTLVEKALQKIPQDLLENFGGEQVYSGGGNAIFSFDTEEHYKAFNRIFSRKLLLQMPGIHYVTVCSQQSEDLSQDIDKLFREMAQKKNTSVQFCNFHTLPPMAQSNADGEQIIAIDIGKDGEYFSFSAWKKHIAGEAETKKSKMTEFDDIADVFMSKSERMMAVIHIDGNNMGKILSNAYKHIEKISEIKDISNKVEQAFSNALKEMEQVLFQIEQEEAKKQDLDETKNTPHYRLIYQNGDDVTFVCHSCYAFRAVCTFFNVLMTCKENELKDFSASAGIAFVKPHYPFNKAYAIAHHRCEMAKKKAKKKLETAQNKLDVGFWLDYEVVRGSDHSDEMMQYEARPYYVCGLPEKHIESNIGVLEALLSTLSCISHSKLKDLRNAFLFNDINYVSALMVSTGQIIQGEYRLYGGKTEDGAQGDFQVDGKGCLIGSDKVNVIYDALEIMDINKVPIKRPTTGEAIV